MKYEIGQKLWLASWDSSEDYVRCPDCGGTGRLLVTFHDETTVSIECAGCASGYNPPTGYVRVYNRRAKALPVIITGVEVRDGKTEWRTNSHYCPDEADLYDNENDCLAGALLKAQKADQEEREKIGAKEKPTRTWAWNASYHRKEIKRCKESIEYHERKLAAANLKARSEEASIALPQQQL
jgi:ribosomal protein S27E